MRRTDEGLGGRGDGEDGGGDNQHGEYAEWRLERASAT